MEVTTEPNGPCAPAEVSQLPATVERYHVPRVLTVSEVTAYSDLIKAVSQKVMAENVHYGKIPNAGNKPTLLKAGAELLTVTFQLSPHYIERRVIERDDFIAYVIECQLTTRDGAVVATGMGACNSREKKYRYRSTNTGRSVPEDYWKHRDKELLGGPQFEPRKITDPKTKRTSWVIFEQVENTEIWDLQNTLHKMAQKRSLIAATLNATATSSYFTQDLEDMASDNPAVTHEAGNAAPPDEAVSNGAPPAEAPPNSDPASDLYVDFLTKLQDAKSMTELDEVAFAIRGKKESLTEGEIKGLGDTYTARKKVLSPSRKAESKGAAK